MRTPEEGHTKACLAYAMICAIQNSRDDGHGDVPFRIWAQNNGALEWADDYLADGTVTCTCPDVHPNPCEGHESLAGDHMGEAVFCDGTCTGLVWHLESLAPTLRANDRVTTDRDRVTCDHCLDQM